MIYRSPKGELKKLILTLILILCYETSFAQILKPNVDSIVEEHFKDSSSVGLSIGIIQNGVVSDYYFGGKYTRDIKDIDSTTLFEIGSITKLYTAFILASLENEKKISRYDLLSKHLPKNITMGKKWASKVRLVDLATHTSGLPSFENSKSLMALEGFDENNPYGLFSEDFMMRILNETDTLINYGEINYSNFGMGLLGLAMARAEKTTFENLFMKYLITGQKLSSTFTIVSERDLTNIAIPHRNLEKMPLIQLAELSPSGSIKTTMPDLLKFLNLHIQPPNGIKPVIEMVLTNHLESGNQAVSLGWGIHSIKGETVYFHTGGTYGSSSVVIVIPSKNSGVALLANSAEGTLTNFAIKLVENLIE